MIRMEIALFLVLTLVASVYFSAGKKPGNLHRAFSALLILTMINLVFDGLTVYTVNRLDVFPIFHTARMGQKIRRSPLSSLCGAALKKALPRVRAGKGGFFELTIDNEQLTMRIKV